GRPLTGRILVPFAPESELSGVGVRDFLLAVWYRRSFTVPAAWAGEHVHLRFQAVDYDTTVWCDGREVARHRGGATPFSCDLGALPPGSEHVLVVRARDDHRPPQPRGKQSQRLEPWSVFYPRTTGIWQTVWLEAVPETWLGRPRFVPDLPGGALRLEQPVGGRVLDHRVRATVRDAGGVAVRGEATVGSGFVALVDLPLPADRRRLWSPEDPHLYDVDLELVDTTGAVVDRAESYAGLRSVNVRGQAVHLNGRPRFQRLVLDQGYYPDGILTAPSDAALRRDIELARSAGFDGARLHQKVFEERFLYWADRLGYLCWGEFGDWGCAGYGPDESRQRPTAAWITQWLEAVERDFSHPSIVGWCPLNETAQPLHDAWTDLDDVTRGMFLATKALDRTRPVLDASGYSHRVPESDVWDCHDYEQDPDRFRAHHAGLERGEPFSNRFGGLPISLPYGGQPFFVSEFGGIRWSPADVEGDRSWGYGEGPDTVEDFYRRFAGLCHTLLDNPAMFGYCYTQLTDVYQEHNGLYTFQRQPKFDLERLREIQRRPAAIERGGITAGETPREPSRGS
ncbi:MAG: beta-galactosidase, partial [Candidatus Dormibacteraeota bacterium]|nr:beta-galactosidase [Candidatus Dormibacteraeota bacterium]